MSEQSENKTGSKPNYIAYSVRPGKKNDGHWQKIGAAWNNKGDGLTLELNAIPLDGKVVLRNREALEKMRAQRQNKTLGQSHSP